MRSYKFKPVSQLDARVGDYLIPKEDEVSVRKDRPYEIIDFGGDYNYARYSNDIGIICADKEHRMPTFRLVPTIDYGDYELRDGDIIRVTQKYVDLCGDKVKRGELAVVQGISDLSTGDKELHILGTGKSALLTYQSELRYEVVGKEVEDYHHLTNGTIIRMKEKYTDDFGDSLKKNEIAVVEAVWLDDDEILVRNRKGVLISMSISGINKIPFSIIGVAYEEEE